MVHRLTGLDYACTCLHLTPTTCSEGSVADQTLATRLRSLVLASAAATLVGACAGIHSQPTRTGTQPGTAGMCAPAIARAHVALARVPDSTGVAHAEHAAAMAEYHACLAGVSR